MNCEILRTLYLRCNGEVRCNDNAGEPVLLGVVDAEDPSWTMARLIRNERYEHIRTSFSAGRVPWDGVCERCAFLRPAMPLQDQLARRRITKLQVEPSLGCNLSCPCCSNRRQRRKLSKPHIMPVPWYERVLRSLRDDGYRLKTIEYCGQGEPLTHPRFHELVSLARRYFPSARQRLITNGNFDYRAATGGLPLEEIYVSCDGVRQQSYEQYRQGGNVHTALQFMGDAVTGAAGSHQVLVWKYILFEFNDGEDELREAQSTAERLGVDTLLFTVTSSKHRSQTYTRDNLNTFPIASANAHLEHCAAFYPGASYGQKRASRFEPHSLWGWVASLRRRRQSWACLDEVIRQPQDVLVLRGWAAATERLSHVEIHCDGQLVGTAKLTALRNDVLRVHPHFLRQRAGFYLSTKLERPPRPLAQISVALFHEERRLGRLVDTYEFASRPS